MESVNPATNTQFATYDEPSPDHIDTVLEDAVDAYDDWRETSFQTRRRLMNDAADVLRENVDEYAELMTKEMGKPIEQARAEVNKCAWVCEYYAETAEEHLADEVSRGPDSARTYVRYEPLGPVLAVMPWNFPFWQVFRFAAPNLTAGNVGLLKHASNVPGCAQAIEDVFETAGFPDGVFQSLLIGSGTVEDLIEDDRIKAVTLTGSEPAGRAVAETAGSELKKTVLELGGSDPFVVLDDAPLEQTLEKAVYARTQNNGQSCIAAKRFIVHEAIYDEFVGGFVEKLDALTVGDPLDESTDIGPMARPDLLEQLHDQVQRSIDAGADCVLGGEPLDRDGAYYPPTVLTNVPREAAAACEETFGPVATIFQVSDDEEAIALANDVDFGLGASVWTSNTDRGQRFAHAFEAGCCFVNEIVKSDPRLPFGGIKNSGYGRELSGHGIREFVNKKTVYIEDALDEDSA